MLDIPVALLVLVATKSSEVPEHRRTSTEFFSPLVRLGISALSPDVIRIDVELTPYPDRACGEIWGYEEVGY